MLCSLLNGKERKEIGKDPSRTDSLNSWPSEVGGRRKEEGGERASGGGALTQI